ncbi:MAG TPA: lactate racemase domain-containing protein [Actinomycetota bacterium]
MREHLVFGNAWVEADLPDDAHVVPPGLSLPVPPAGDLAAEILHALRGPMDTEPLAELARGAGRVTVAFDDPTVPCYAPLWETALPLVLQELERGGAARERVTLLCANALHRQFTADELGRLIGTGLAGEFAAAGRLRCHDAEDPDGLEHLGDTDPGEPVDVSRAVTESDLTVYVNASTTRGFSGGWKSVCVGLSSYRSIRTHHTPDTMSMSIDGNRMHEALDRMGAVVERELGPGRIFKVETLLSNPLEVHRVLAGSVRATRDEVMRVTREHQRPRRTLLDERADVVLYGVPDWSPYAAYSFTNPILTLISTGLGYLGGMIEAVGAPGCTVILATPCPDRWDDVHHPSYREVWERVLPETRDPYDARDRFEPELAAREDLVERYRTGFGFHPTHPIMALYPLKRLRHAGRVVVAGAESPDVVRHVGFEPAATVEEALGIAADVHGPNPSVAFVRYPPAVSRQ